MRTKVQGLSQASERIPLVEGLYRVRAVRFEPAGHTCRVAEERHQVFARF
jgi:hypothetical protein